MSEFIQRTQPTTFGSRVVLVVGILLALPTFIQGQEPGGATQNGEWHYIGGDAWHQRYSPLDQIDADNFEDLRVAWVWRGDNFGPSVDYTMRSNPLYVDGILYTVVGMRRVVVAIDPGTGETLWTYREPHTTRWERSPRRNYGKGVAYAEVDGRGVIYVSTPGFFLHALDAKTGLPLENWGRPVPLDGFSQTGVVDLVQDLIRDWGPWQKYQVEDRGSYDPDFGIPVELGNITSSSPPIVVNGVVIVSNSSQQGYYQVRRENVPGDVLGYDARTGELLWKFHVIPRPGEYGHDTWENEAWEWTGDVSSWAPMSADPELGIVYIPTNGPTNDFYSGFRPGANLYGNSIIALDVQTGERVWHFQTIHNDLWNFDLPMAPALLDVTVDGRDIAAVVINGKAGYTFAFDRATGEPLWPVVERPVPPSYIPGERASPTQPFPTKPEPFAMVGFPEDMVIDYTPELRQEALEILEKLYWGKEPFTPYVHRGNEFGKERGLNCPAQAGNIHGPTAVDPETGIIYVSDTRSCRIPLIVPGDELEDPNDPFVTGTTTMRWVSAADESLVGPQGLPIFKPPYGSITAIDMNTGEHVWVVPNGDTPDRVKNHPALEGVDLPNTGQRSRAISLVTSTLLIHGEGTGGRPLLHALHKRTGERLGTVDIPASGQYGLVTYLHEGQQYVLVSVGGGGHPGSLAALRVP